MTQPILHQATTGIAIGDGVSSQVFMIRQWLRDMGYISDIYAEHIHPDLADDVLPIVDYQPQAGEGQLIYHHSIGSGVTNHLVSLPVRLILIYHNITPPEFVTHIDPKLAQELILGREQLNTLREHTDLALGVSPYNTRELTEVGFQKTGVLPLVLDEQQYRIADNPVLRDRLKQSGPNLLFVGRQVPNKKQEDLIKLLYYYHRIAPEARLMLVGSSWLPAYADWLCDLAQDLGLEDAVCMLGHVSHQDMVTCYRNADLYVSMSEHEGFGLPLVESMALDLPVLAYAAGGVPDTLGEAGIVFHHKDFEALAELVDMLIKDTALRTQILIKQQARVKSFWEPQVRQVLAEYLETCYNPSWKNSSRNR